MTLSTQKKTNKHRKSNIKINDQYITPTNILKLELELLGLKSESPNFYFDIDLATNPFALNYHKKSGLLHKNSIYYDINNKFLNRQDYDKLLTYNRFHVNPPFSRFKDFSLEVIELYKQQYLKEGVFLCNSNTETKAYQALLSNSTYSFMLNRRISFIKVELHLEKGFLYPKLVPVTQNLTGQTLFVFRNFVDSAAICQDYLHDLRLKLSKFGTLTNVPKRQNFYYEVKR